MTTDQKIDEILKIVREQGDRHDLRLVQMADRFSQIDAHFVRLEAKIDIVFDSLTQDIQVFAEDLHRVEKRTARLEKKTLS